MNNQLANLRNQKRILSATEVTFDVLNYLGYISLEIITFYMWDRQFWERA